MCELKFLISEQITDTPSPSNRETSLFNFANNSLTFNNVKRKKQLDAKDLSENEKKLLEMSKEFTNDLIYLKEQMKNLNSKNKFFTSENFYEKIEIFDCYSEDKKLDHISTRSMNTKIPHFYFNSIPNIISKDSVRFFINNSRKGKLPIFDFHIKKIDDSAYEKIVID